MKDSADNKLSEYPSMHYVEPHEVWLEMVEDDLKYQKHLPTSNPSGWVTVYKHGTLWDIRNLIDLDISHCQKLARGYLEMDIVIRD